MQPLATNRPRRSLRAWRLAGFQWAVGLAVVAGLHVEYRIGVVHPPGWLFAGLLLALAAGCLFGLRGILAGPGRSRVAGRWLVGAAPVASLLALFVLAPLRFQARDVRPTTAAAASYMAWVNAAEVAVPWAYPRRLESDRVVMFYRDGLADPGQDLADMDRHVADLERQSGRPLLAKIQWVRGVPPGTAGLSTPGFAFGSDASPAGRLDRHELAHSVLNQHVAPGSVPPALLNEGWAEAVSREDPRHALGALQLRREVAQLCRLTDGEFAETLSGFLDPAGMGQLVQASKDRGEDFSLLTEFTGDFWYHRGRGPVYGFGRSFVAYLIREYGTPKFIDLYYRVRPGTFAADCREVFGVSAVELERQFWLDVARPQ